ncbi:MAG: PilN domain-containing protein [Planctomycetota bacterium]|nr:MAG: PilN domain-containing protein [Planctomycetota bacterium]
MSGLKMNSCTVGLELSGNRIRMAAIMGSRADAHPSSPRRLQCAEIVIPDTESSTPTGLPPASTLVPLFKAALGRLGITGGHAAVAVGGQHMVLRNFVGSDAQVRVELQQAVKRSINYVQLGLGDRIAGKYVRRMVDGRTHALIGISAMKILDPLTESLKQVGLHVKVIEPVMVALTRMTTITGQLNSEAALLILVDQNGIEIGVVSEDQIIFSRCLKSIDCQDLESQIPRGTSNLPRELEKVARYYMRTFGASEEIHQAIIYGPEELVRPHAEALKNSEEFKTDFLRIDNRVSEALAVDSRDLAANQTQTLALGAAASLFNESSKVIGPNLVSESKAKRYPPLEKIIRTLIWPTLAAILIWGAVYFVQVHLGSKLTDLRIEANRSSPVEITYRKLRQQMNHIEQRAAQLNELSLMFKERNWNLILETIRICVPDHLWLTSVKFTKDRQLTIKGAAYDDSLIYQFRKNLGGAPLLNNVTIVAITSVQRGNTLSTEFSVECTVLSSFQVSDASNP